MCKETVFSSLDLKLWVTNFAVSPVFTMDLSEKMAKTTDRVVVVDEDFSDVFYSIAQSS